jgi:hypothetical protein
MYVWNETVAKRGSVEIISCVKHYIDNVLSPDTDTLIVFSDNCAGQNKNINILLYYLSLIHSGRFSTIIHSYLISGHSYLPCDRDFGLIEKRSRSHSHVFTSKGWCKIIEESRKSNPFHVVQMETSHFLNFDVLKQNTTIRKHASSQFSKARYFKITSSFKIGYKMSLSYSGIVDGHLETDDPAEVQVSLQKGKGTVYRQDRFDLSQVIVPPKYKGSVPINPAKVKDLKELMRFVPPDDTPFFEAIFASHTTSPATTEITPNNDDNEVEEDDEHAIDYSE